MSEIEKTIPIEVLRYRPEQDTEPILQTFQVPFTDDMSVLQGLQYIKDYLDGSLSFRWSCWAPGTASGTCWRASSAGPSRVGAPACTGGPG